MKHLKIDDISRADFVEPRSPAPSSGDDVPAEPVSMKNDPLNDDYDLTNLHPLSCGAVLRYISYRNLP